MRILKEPCYIYHTGSRMSAAFVFYLLSWGAALAVSVFLGYVLGVTLSSVAMRATKIEVEVLDPKENVEDVINSGSSAELRLGSTTFDLTLNVTLRYPLYGSVSDTLQLSNFSQESSEGQAFDLYRIVLGTTGLPSGTCNDAADCYGAITQTDISARVVTHSEDFCRILLYSGSGVLPNSPGKTAIDVVSTILISFVILYMYALILRPLVFVLASSGSGTRTYPDPIYARARGVSSGAI